MTASWTANGSTPLRSDRDDTRRAADRRRRSSAPTVAAARIVRRLRQAVDWRPEIDEILELLGRSMSGHRSILFRLRELPGQGLTQSVAAYWVDETVEGISSPPTVIVQAVVHSDPLLGRIAEEGRQGKMFAGLTRDIEGFLRQDFENQKIKSFLSIPIFANGNSWGSVAINDCVRRTHLDATTTRRRSRSSRWRLATPSSAASPTRMSAR